MSFSENIEYLMAHPGAVAVAVYAFSGGQLASNVNTLIGFSGHEGWRPKLAAAMALNIATNTDIIVFVGEHTILAECRNGERIAIVYPTGTPISKVIRRLLRKAAGPKREASRVIADKPSAAA